MKLQQTAVSIIIVILQIKIHVGERMKSTCGRRLVSHTSLIYNGFPSNEGDWPWHAVIYDFSNFSVKYRCGGTVLNSNIILTAAHCVVENNRTVIPQRIQVHLGRHSLILAGTYTQQFVAHMVIPHPNYTVATQSDDIAIIRLSTEATFGNYVQPICLWDSNKVNILEVIGKYGTVVGFGITETKNLSEVLRQTSMPVVSETTCLSSNRPVFGLYLSDKNFCAGIRNGTSACQGDSGGSLTFEKNEVYYIRGIVSLTARAQDTDQPCSLSDYVLFTDVAKYLNWIEEVAPELRQSAQKSVIKKKREPVNYQLSGNVMWSSNCDFFGGDFKNQMSRREDCGDICSNNDICTHFTWIPSGVCLLKNIGSNPPAVANNDALCGYVVRHSASRLFDFHTFGSARWSLNCSFNGNDIGNMKSSSMDCAGICEDRGDCTHFNWTSYEDGTCWLKGSAVSSPNRIDNPYALCGFFVSDWKVSGNVRWNHNCDYRNDDIASQKFSRNACKEWCSRRNDCHKFAWINLDEGTCFLYGNRATITQSNTNGTICGWIKRG